MTTALAITAHHDDAILWLGGTILRTQPLGWKWTLVALCVPDLARQKYFKDYCKSMSAKAHAFTFHDYQHGAPYHRNPKAVLQAAIVHACAGSRFDWVFTHSREPDSEYGHNANHTEVREVTRTLVKAGHLGRDVRGLAHFSYSPLYALTGLATVASPQADFFLQLTYPELHTKCAWCIHAPDAETNLKYLSFPCPNPEAFTGDSLDLPHPFTRRPR